MQSPSDLGRIRGGLFVLGVNQLAQKTLFGLLKIGAADRNARAVVHCEFVVAHRLNVFEIHPVALVTADKAAGPADECLGRFLREEGTPQRNDSCLAQDALHILHVLQRNPENSAVLPNGDLNRTVTQRGQCLIQCRPDTLMQL